MLKWIIDHPCHCHWVCGRSQLIEDVQEEVKCRIIYPLNQLNLGIK